MLVTSCTSSTAQPPDQSGNVFSLRGDASVSATAEGRDLMKYVARCALPPSATLRLDDADGTSVVGGLGLATDWLSQPLTRQGQRWLSACLLAHVNAFGEHVLISVRGAHPQLVESVTAEERQAMPVQEGAFFGNLFADEPIAYVCAGEGAVNAQEKRRVCTAASEPGSVSRCGMIFVGDRKSVV